MDELMGVSGHLRKMATTHQPASDGPNVHYQLRLDDQQWSLMSLLGQSIQLIFSGQIQCIHCGRATRKSFSQGYCYPCFKSLAQCDSCIVKPETCHYHLGTCREPQWGRDHCFQPHVVYLANSSGLKVGITRGTQVPTRWMDQGASAALPVLQVPDRLASGQAEMTFKDSVNDRTAWQAMLKNQVPDLSLEEERDRLLAEYHDRLSASLGTAPQVLIESVRHFHYPVLEYPTKVKSLNPEKSPVIEGTLMGIKGQYLILDTGVINLRKFGGYDVTLLADALTETDDETASLSISASSGQTSLF
ncbi:hypothetical protein BFW38_03570 [Terasakiispira papahanaumokuakeensis]|uniref:DUF2797 domain-containing protein n=1 Tax=Terasakiispira papahanaumokuakeensis TaxID=197479 RepID=A0A1E2V6Y0_9GAMM|nr:DUF2797 domain-containing protein [Terasakiispira papahanaumokuakeensis]ODC02759.1 hypothetical protein BFW38_03570 [Terasakiispira papahanaumokuakeensis]